MMTEEPKRRTSNFFPAPGPEPSLLSSPFPTPIISSGPFSALDPALHKSTASPFSADLFAIDRLGDLLNTPSGRPVDPQVLLTPRDLFDESEPAARPSLLQQLLLSPGRLSRRSPAAGRPFTAPFLGPVPEFDLSQRLGALELGLELIETPSRSSIWSTPRNDGLPLLRPWGEPWPRDGDESRSEDLGPAFLKTGRVSDPRASDWSVEPWVESMGSSEPSETDAKKNIYSAKVHRPVFVPQAGTAAMATEKARPERAAGTERSEPSEKVHRSERSEKSENAENTARLWKADRGERSERPERPERPERSEKVSSSKVSRQEVVGRKGKAEVIEKSYHHDGCKNIGPKRSNIVINLGSTSACAPHTSGSSRHVLNRLHVKEYPEDYCSTFYKRNRHGYMFIRELSNSLKVNTNGPKSWVTIKVCMGSDDPQKLKVDVKRLPVWKPINLNQPTATRKFSRRDSQRKDRRRSPR